MNTKHILFTFSAALMSLVAMAEIPTDYYASLEGKSNAQLIQAIFNTISSHTDVTYSGLWAVYDETDVYPADSADKAGQIWDIYSSCDYIYSTNQCGNVGAVCHCYNREHSIPQSWFKEASPMKADIFHVYPTDGAVNGQRSNYPYGECAQGTNKGGHALGRLGLSTFVGYESVGTVFEPTDEYKGDLARTYFYMVACYYDKNFTQDNQGYGQKVFTWSNGQAGLTPYAIALFMKWSREDPVSEKEIARNEAIYGHQHNRNPFIDLPGLEEYLWGTKQNVAYSQNEATGYLLAPVVDEAQQPCKYLCNGRVVIEVDGVRYDLMGQRSKE